MRKFIYYTEFAQMINSPRTKVRVVSLIDYAPHCVLRIKSEEEDEEEEQEEETIPSATHAHTQSKVVTVSDTETLAY